MNPTTLVMAYYMNPGMLRRYYNQLKGLPQHIKDGLALRIVDDGSPQEVAAFGPPPDLGLKDIQVWRCKVDIRWNQDAARNLGVEKSTTPWLLLTDIDHLVTQNVLRDVMFGRADPRTVYRFSRCSEPELAPYKPHPNSWFMHRDLYMQIGGYDERFAGYYGTDADFRDRLAKAADKIIMLKSRLIRVPREVTPDASTTTYKRKTPEDGEAIRRIKGERNALVGWSTLWRNLPYERVY